MIAQLTDFITLPFPLLTGQREALPYRYWFDDFDDPINVPYLIVSRDIPEAGWMQAQSLEEHYRELFRLGFDDESEDD